MLCVKDVVSKMVCERWCLTKWCVKGCVKQFCERLCKKVVCERWRVTKLCVKDGLCVTKLCVKDGLCVCVTKLCVKNGVCERWCVKDGV